VRPSPLPFPRPLSSADALAARPVALAGVHRVVVLHQASEAAVRHLLRAHPTFHNAQRAWVADAVHGVACMQARYAHLSGSTDPAWLLAFHLLHRGWDAADASLHSGVGEEDLRTRAAHPPAWPNDAVAAFGARHSFPLDLAKRLMDALGPDASAFADACNVPAAPVLRANALRVGRDDLLAQLTGLGWQVEPTASSPWGIRLRAHVGLRGSQPWRDGLFEVQDEGSQLIALATPVEPGMTVLDLCAGRGGKTLALAAQMQDRGTLHATDLNPARLHDLRGRAGRLGLTSVVVHAWRDLPPLQADVVLVDAPCSQLGTLRRSPDLRWYLTPYELDAFPTTQRSLLEKARTLCRPGGRILYATCTVLPAENEQVVQDVSATGLTMEPVTAGPLKGTPWLNLRPDTHGTDGFFMAQLRTPEKTRPAP
jgi:16S rRNA (cytosine967-C5)-methyltransferase